MKLIPQSAGRHNIYMLK